jgi:hypothetical protein
MIDQLDKVNIVLQRHFQDARTFPSLPLSSCQVLTLQFCCDHSYSTRRDGSWLSAEQNEENKVRAGRWARRSKRYHFGIHIWSSVRGARTLLIASFDLHSCGFVYLNFSQTFHNVP